MYPDANQANTDKRRDQDTVMAVSAQFRRDIGWAVKQMWNGQKVTRSGWNGRGQFLALQVPDKGSKMTLPYIYISTVHRDLVPWLASQTDILATDWQMFEAE